MNKMLNALNMIYYFILLTTHIHVISLVLLYLYMIRSLQNLKYVEKKKLKVIFFF
jgi:hypothetical protein